MVDIVKRYICDICEKTCCVNKDADDSLSWCTPTELGDMCPDCLRAWEENKESFITRMKKENGKDLV